jgi:hypothetical protein
MPKSGKGNENDRKKYSSVECRDISDYEESGREGESEGSQSGFASISWFPSINLD